MSYSVSLSKQAYKALKKLERADLLRVQAAIELLSETPRPPRVKKLRGQENLWRVRTGNIRIIYEIHDHKLLVMVMHLGDRKEIYRNLP